MESVVNRDRTADEQGRPVVIPHGPIALEGELAVPVGSRGIVLFAHGSGSSRHSPRNRRVARLLREAGLATLLVDLLTTDEELLEAAGGRLRFDIPLLAGRLVATLDWLAQAPGTRGLHLGLLGASTGGAAALVAAAERPHLVRAVVARGGRPDLAGPALGAVVAPTLLIVGGRDEPVLDLNRRAMQELHCEKELVVIADATHLFEEPGALDEVARFAAAWFVRYLSPPGAPER